MTDKPLLHYGWDVSPYSAKTRTYLRFKRVIPWKDVHPSALQLTGKIQKAVGQMIMPTIERPDGRWMQDTSEIIDTLEAEHPQPSIVPAGPTQRLASALMEVHADEWLPTVIMHTRWNYPESADFARREFAREGFPLVPRIVGEQLVRPIWKKMASYREVLGVRPDTTPGIEAFAKELIARLDAHFADHDFLLGGRPCIGDFALFGPLWAHVWRDPATRHWFADAPNVREWMTRVKMPPPEPGVFLPNDEVPATLDPIFKTIFAEQWVYIRHLADRIDAWCADNPGATRVPRSLGDHPFTIGGHTGTRRLVTFTHWMAQRPRDTYAALDNADRAAADAWLSRVGGTAALQHTPKARFARRDFKMLLAVPS